MYWGSVRFFKNLILLCVVALILTPTLLAVHKHATLTDTREQVVSLQEEITQMQQQLEAAQSREAPSAEPTDAPESAAFFSAEAPAYQSLYPDFYAPQPLDIQDSVSDDKVIYLTFDDGPTSNTDLALKILAEENIKATFFVTGCSDESSISRLQNIAAQGHTLGMHSFSHDYAIIYTSVEAFLDDMYQIFTTIQDATGVAPTVFRFPGGSINSYNSGIYQELLAEMLRRGFVPHDWNISAQDATSTPLAEEKLLQNVISSAAGKERGFVLMHDGVSHYTTIQALDDIIDYFQELGYRFDCIHPDTKPILFAYPD